MSKKQYYTEQYIIIQLYNTSIVFPCINCNCKWCPIPQADCLPPVRPSAVGSSSLAPALRSQTRTCRWSQTWPHPAARSDWWHNPEMAAGSLCQSLQPRGRKTTEPPGSHYHWPTAFQSQCSPEKENMQQTE